MSALQRAGRRGLYVPQDIATSAAVEEESGAAGFDLTNADAIREAESVFDASVQPPESVVIGLRGLKPTMHLRLNRKGKLSREWSIDANGNARKAEYEARWELWDTDESGRNYLVMVLRDENGNFREPGEWLVERFRKFNPANFRSLQEMLDFAHAENRTLREMEAEGNWKEFCNFAGEWVWWRLHSTEATGKLPEIRG